MCVRKPPREGKISLRRIEPSGAYAGLGTFRTFKEEIIPVLTSSSRKCERNSFQLVLQSYHYPDNKSRQRQEKKIIGQAFMYIDAKF